MKVSIASRFALLCGLSFLIFSFFASWSSLPLQSFSSAAVCSYSLSTTSRNFASGAGLGSVKVTTSESSCAWTATSNVPWVTISAGASGTGNGTVSYTVALNPTTATRSGTLTIAGQSFTVNQDAGTLALQFYPLPRPVRLLDTRPGQGNCDSVNAPIAAGTSLATLARTTCEGITIPTQAQAVVGNITVINQTAQTGFLTLYPTGVSLPLAANMIYGPSGILANNFTVGLSGNGEFSIFGERTIDVIVDISGYYAPPGTGGLYYHPLAKPVRLLDTRPSQGNCDNIAAPIAAGTSLTTLARTTCEGLTIPAAAQAIVGNATVINGSGQTGYLTIFPDGVTAPLAANMVYFPGNILSNAFTVGLSNDGKFNIFGERTIDMVVDVAGYYSTEANDANGAGLLFNPLPRPLRILDTRASQGNCDSVGTPITAGTSIAAPGRLTCEGLTIPATAQTVLGNVTVINQTAQAGFLTLYPDGVAQPLAANMVYFPGQILSNAFVVGLNASTGQYRVFAERTLEAIVDVSGFFAPSATNLAPAADSGADQTIALSDTALLTGAVSDDGLPLNTLTVTWSQVSGPGLVTFGNANQIATTATFSQSGVYVLRLTANDSLLSAQDELTITVNGGPLAVNAGSDQVVTLPNTTFLLGTVTGGNGLVTTSWSKLSGPGTVLFSNASATTTTAIIGANGVYVLRLSATDTQGTVNDDVQVTVNADPTPPPPNPATVAPVLDLTVATTIGTATSFLYTGANPIQTGVAPGVINPVRAAVLRGRVLDKNNQPLSLVKITVLNHPEFGQTFSRADGKFDLAVNGGNVLTVQYEKLGYQTLQRTNNIPWQDYGGIPDAVLIGYDANVTRVDLLASTPVQIAQSSLSTDTAGTRRTTLLFKQGTTATMKLPGGAMAGLDKLHVRATEFTVGANGLNTMPGTLPANSAYTYAVEYSIDEAVAAGALETTFSQPVAQYNENFLNFPVGVDIPSGAYDRTTGQWIASASGRVVKILSITSGTANLDVTGSGQPATQAQYDALDINVAERQTLATLYAINQSLWRVPVIHFSPWDSNWPISPPPNSEPPSNPPPQCDT